MAAALAGAALVVMQAQSRPAPPSPSTAATGKSFDWAYWGSDERSTRYSPLDQIDAGNFGKMQVLWRWSAANYGPEPDLIYRATPLYVNGKL